MTFQSEPKKQNPYPKLLNEFEKKRNRDWLKAKQGMKENQSFKSLDSKRLQMFSGKRGK
jgi:hypothetical protein